MAQSVVAAVPLAVIRGGVGRTYLQTEWDRAKKASLCYLHTEMLFYLEM